MYRVYQHLSLNRIQSATFTYETCTCWCDSVEQCRWINLRNPRYSRFNLTLGEITLPVEALVLPNLGPEDTVAVAKTSDS